MDHADQVARLAAFQHLAELSHRYGETLPYAQLRPGFPFEGRLIKYLGPQGIFTPAGWDLPLSISTSPDNPYDDEVAPNGVYYRYRGTDPNHRDNVGLKRAMGARAPLIYFHAVAQGEYLPVWPVFIIEADDARLTFTVADESLRGVAGQLGQSQLREPLPRYDQRLVRARLHQATFRRQVIAAYREKCAICRLRHVELLDAAHILRDAHPDSRPEVPNGLALCKLHHAAFDRNIVGVRPDLVVEVRRDILDEEDGPMLQHGLQGFQGQALHVPTRSHHRPKAEYLEQRYEEFREAG